MSTSTTNLIARSAPFNVALFPKLRVSAPLTHGAPLRFTVGMTTVVHISDLHLERFPANLPAALKLVGDQPVDLFLVGGDNGGRSGIDKTVGAVRERWPQVPIGWVMGNHDLWEQPYTYLWESFDDLPATYLETANLELAGLTVVGTYGHYDYSGRDSSIPLVCFENYTFRNLRWNDHFIERGGRSDPEIAGEIAEQFLQRYRAAVIRALPIVVLTHTSPFPPPDVLRRSFVSGYCVNSKIGDVLLAAQRPPSVVFWGHTHRRSETAPHGFPMINPGSDYREVAIARYRI